MCTDEAAQWNACPALLISIARTRAVLDKNRSMAELNSSKPKEDKLSIIFAPSMLYGTLKFFNVAKHIIKRENNDKKELMQMAAKIFTPILQSVCRIKFSSTIFRLLRQLVDFNFNYNQL